MLKRISSLLFEDDIDDDEVEDDETGQSPVIAPSPRPSASSRREQVNIQPTVSSSRREQPVSTQPAKREPAVVAQPTYRREQVSAPQAPRREAVVPQPLVQEQVAAEQPKEESPRTVMQRIDVTQNIKSEANARPQPRRTDSVFNEAPVTIRNVDAPVSETRREPSSAPAPRPAPASRPAPATSRPASAPSRPATEQKPSMSTLGIKADAPASAPNSSARSSRSEKQKKDTQPTYQFQPVISPIFGVDEKDLDAVKTTNSKVSARESSKQANNITPIISPMYGKSTEESTLSAPQPQQTQMVHSKSSLPSMPSIQPTAAPVVSAPVIIQEPEPQEKPSAVEDEIPEFSLDDILKVGDEEFAKEKRAVDTDDSIFPDFTFGDDEEDDASLRESIVFNRRKE